MSFVYGILGLIIGTTLYIALPFLIPQTTPISFRNKLGTMYFKQAARFYGRILILVNRHGDGTIQTSSFDHAKQADTITRDDETLYFDDPIGNMTRLYNYPLGLASMEYGKIISPMDVAIANGLRELHDTNQLIQNFVLEGGESVQAIARHIKVPTGWRLFDLRDPGERMIESFEPNDPEKAEEDMKRSQAGYNTRSVMDIMLFVMIAAGSSVLAWLIWSNSSTGGGSVISLPDTFGMLIGVVV